MDYLFNKKLMEQALALARKARIIAPPNPWVGCVIVKNGMIIGEGHTLAPGNAHAEINALKQAKENAEGATAFITLEPCCHFGKTPPCTKALIESKIKKVVIGIVDPDQRVAGKGIQELQSAGIEVELGLCAEDISFLLAPYLHHRKTALPYCIGKAAISVDGRIAAPDGTSKWLTGDEARKNAHFLRAESQAILIGAGTALKDSPSLTVRNEVEPPFKAPLRVILDARGRVLPPTPLLNTSLAPTLIVTSKMCSKSTLDYWVESGVEVAVVNQEDNQQGLNLKEVLQLLGKRDILQLLIEGGSEVLGSFLKESLFQQLSLYVAPYVLGNQGIPLFQSSHISTLSTAPRLALKKTTCLDCSVRLDYLYTS